MNGQDYITKAKLFRIENEKRDIHSDGAGCMSLFLLYRKMSPIKQKRSARMCTDAKGVLLQKTCNAHLARKVEQVPHE